MSRSKLLIIAAGLVAVTVAVWFFGMRARNQDLDQVTETVEHLDAMPTVGPIKAPTISRETTFVTAPVDSDGFVDYLAALNEHLREGMTVDNNAAVLFARGGLGMGIRTNRRARTLAILGVEESDLLVPGYDKWAERGDQKVLDQVIDQPWEGSQFPQVLEWLERNEAALRVIVEGTQCSRCYFPMLTDDNDEKLVLHILLDMHQDSRDAAKCLVARAMLRMGRGQFEEAKRDLLACHRLSRLMGQTPNLICGLVCYEIDATAWRGDAALLRFTNLDAPAALEFQRALSELPPFPTIADNVDFVERIQLLDAVTSKWKVPSHSNLTIAFDECLRLCNQELDRYVDALRPATFPQRDNALNSLIRDLRIANQGFGDPSTYVSRVFAQNHSPEVFGRKVGQFYFTRLLPNIGMSVKFETKAKTRIALLRLGFAATAHYAEKGEYPDKLDDLSPRFISEIPRDPFSDGQFNYKNEGHAFLLQSLGADGEDDRVKPNVNQAPGDDLILFVTRPGAK
ncbi:MAG: hypothetical protein JWP89_5945 [Schlesneria sp.]|nr:hypothetical protein [Schlesneria sp.]